MQIYLKHALEKKKVIIEHRIIMKTITVWPFLNNRLKVQRAGKKAFAKKVWIKIRLYSIYCSGLYSPTIHAQEHS